MKKLLTILVLCAVCICCAIGFSACDENAADGQNAQILSIYNTYVAYAEENGETPLSYEEWIKSIKGENGKDGKDGINGIDGKNGKDGVSIVKIEKTSTDGLIDTYTITYSNSETTTFTVKNGKNGENGGKGADGTTPQLRVNSDTNEWEVSYDKGATWTGLGVKAKGDNGTDGKIPEIRVNNEIGYIQWKYTDESETEWKNLQRINIECVHDWSEYFVNENATCEHIGEKYRYCTKCNQKETYIIPIIAHDWKITEKVAATCADGHINYECSMCHDTKTEILVATGEHQWKITGIESENCQTTGKVFYKCKVCSAEKTEETEQAVHLSLSENETCPNCGYKCVRKIDNNVLMQNGENDKCTAEFYGENANGCFSTYKSYITDIYIADGVKRIVDSSFTEYNALRSVNLGNGLTKIGSSSFQQCKNLLDVTIPNSVESIGEYAFCNCTSINTISIPDSVKTIYNYSFAGLSGLTSLTFGDNSKLTNIGDYAFSNCKITSIIIPESVESVGIGSFYGCNKLSDIQVPDKNILYKGQVDATSYRSAFCETAWYMAQDDGVVMLNTICLGYKGTISPFDNIEIPANCKYIAQYAFFYQSTLTSIDLSNVQYIGESAFNGCSALTSVIIPDTVTIIGDRAFRDCSSLISINIPNSVMSIGVGAFSNCFSLISIIISKNVTAIGTVAFARCSNLQSIYYTGIEADWEKISLVDYENSDLLNAKRYYYSETKPTTDGDYWHYDIDGTTPIIWE